MAFFGYGVLARVCTDSSLGIGLKARNSLLMEYFPYTSRDLHIIYMFFSARSQKLTSAIRKPFGSQARFVRPKFYHSLFSISCSPEASRSERMQQQAPHIAPLLPSSPQSGPQHPCAPSEEPSATPMHSIIPASPLKRPRPSTLEYHPHAHHHQQQQQTLFQPPGALAVQKPHPAPSATSSISTKLGANLAKALKSVVKVFSTIAR